MLQKDSVPSLNSAVAMATTLLNRDVGGLCRRGRQFARGRAKPHRRFDQPSLQNNTNFGIGHSDHTQNVLNIQPVYPVHLNQDWNLITRPILPVIYQPPFFSGRELHALEQKFGPDISNTEFGLGDLTPELFFSPKKPIQLAPGTSLVWGLGPP